MKKKKHLLNNRQLVAILSSCRNAAAIYTTDDIIIEFANDAMLAFWGKDNSIIGQPLEKGVPELAGQPFKHMLQQVWKTGITDSGIMPAETKIDGDLQTHYFEYEYKAIKDEAGKIYGLLHMAANVTDTILGKQARELALEREQALGREQALNKELLTTNEKLIATNEKLLLTQRDLKNLNLELDERVRSRTQHLTESEDRFQSMAEGSGILIAVADQTRNFVYLTKTWAELTGRTMKELLGLGWVEAIHADDRQRYLDEYLSAFNKREPFVTEFRILNFNKEYCWLMYKGSPRFLPDRTFTGFISSCMDITELKEAERRKDDFISIASHELKTPLTSLKGSLQLLDRMKDQSDWNRLSRLIGQANKSMDKITILINDLLNASRAGDGRLPLNKSTFIVAEMLNKCCNHVRAEGRYNLIFQGDEYLQVYADEDRIEQVVVNFVNNAVKYAPNSTDIFLKAEKAGNMARISVRDSGPGIAKDKIPHLFERYYRADYSGMQYSGLGLGLYICSEIIKQHGGEIGVDTKPGKGSTFWFTLPME